MTCVFSLILSVRVVSAATGSCGDGILQGGEDCDDGSRNGSATSSCTISCTHVLLQCINKGVCGCFDAFQPAHALLGQTVTGGFATDPHGYLQNNGGYPVSAFGFHGPQDIAMDSHYRLLYIADRLNNRVLVFQLDESNIPLHRRADFVLGQPNFETNTAGGGQAGMHLPSGVVVDSLRHRVFVSDSGNHRVLVYTDVTPKRLSKGLLPSVVLGQEDFDGKDPHTASARMRDPHGLAVNIYGELYVADTGNNRVLRFSGEHGIATGQYAETVLGQRNFTGAVMAATLDAMSAPRDVAMDPASQTVFVADTGNHRVLLFRETDLRSITPDTDPNEAYRVLNTFRGADEKSLYGPSSMAVSRDTLFVSDTLNSRVLLFPLGEALEKNQETHAVTLLGQDRFGANYRLPPPDAQSLLYPSGIDIASGDCTLFIADTGNNRISVFRPSQSSTCVAPDPSPGTPFDSCNFNGVCEVAVPGGATESCACEDCARGFCSSGNMCDIVTNACVPVKEKPSSFQTWIPRFERWVSFVQAFFRG